MLLFYFYKSEKRRKACWAKMLTIRILLGTMFNNFRILIDKRIIDIQLKWGVFRMVHAFKRTLRK